MNDIVVAGPATGPVVAVGASAGGIEATLEMLAALPAAFPAPIVLAQHLASRGQFESQLPKLLQWHSALPVQWARHGEVLRPGRVYVAPQESAVTVSRYRALQVVPAMGRPSPSVDALFSSVADACGEDAIGIVLSGFLRDGTAGALAITQAGGRVLVQDPSLSPQPEMPWNALRGAGALAVAPAQLGHAIALVLDRARRTWFDVRPGSAYVAGLERAA